MLEMHAGLMHVGLRSELRELLNVMVYQYFSRYSAVILEQNEARALHLLEGNGFEDWENSDIAMGVSMLIIQITKTYLPSFSAHRTEDCEGILNITMRDDHVAHLEIQASAFDRFILPS